MAAPKGLVDGDIVIGTRDGWWIVLLSEGEKVGRCVSDCLDACVFLPNLSHTRFEEMRPSGALSFYHPTHDCLHISLLHYPNHIPQESPSQWRSLFALERLVSMTISLCSISCERRCRGRCKLLFGTKIRSMVHPKTHWDV